MGIEVTPLEPLERGQLHVMRIKLGMAVLVAVLIALILDSFVFREVLAEWGASQFAVPAFVAVVGLYAVVALARGRWARWGYAFTGREIHVASGWLIARHTIVPALRVQHIDVEQGALQRLFGVATLVLHTAGVINNAVALPGISRAEAETIRDAIRERIGAEA